MNSSREHEQENRALEALVVAALRKHDVDAMSLEKLLAFEQGLTKEDRVALDALGPNLIDEIISRLRRQSRSASAFKTGGESSGRVAPVRLNSKGVKIMKSLVLSVLIISGLVVAVVIGTTMDDNSSSLRSTAFDDETAVMLQRRLGNIEERLEELGQLEDRVDRVVAMVSRESLLEANRPPRRGESSRGESAAASSKGSDDMSEESSVARKLKAGGGEDLREYIVQVMGEVREEQIAEQARRAEERMRELAALRDGPYGNYNYKVNSMAKRLEFSEGQKQHYHLNLVEYNNMIQKSREQEKDDIENRQLYRDQRKEIRKEFIQVIAGSLTPEQAEVFANLPEHEKRPGTSSYFYYGSSTATRSINVLPGGSDFEIEVIQATASSEEGQKPE